MPLQQQSLSANVSQGHKVSDIGIIRKGIISGVSMQNTKSISLTVQKFYRRLKLTADKHDKTLCSLHIDVGA